MSQQAWLPNRLLAALLVLVSVGVATVGSCQDRENSSYLVDTQEQFREAVQNAKPGDHIVLANGTWYDFEIRFTTSGAPDRPVVLTAETQGQVILSGQSNLCLGGDHLVVSGLVFKNGYTPTNTVISYRCKKGEPSNYSRVTETVIDHFTNPERHETDFWVLMFGRFNRFDHNHLEGKGNAGVTMAVRLDAEHNQQNEHRIDHNYFGPRPVLGSNGGETLRIGTSHYSLTDSLTVVENNVFDRCNGEVEIVSSKSGGNTFRGNLFIESRGTLTLRHGNNNIIEGNVFLGNGVPNTGGIRVINKGHVVRNNYLSGLTGYRFGGAFVVMNGVPNSPINRYHQVENVLIENNSMVDCEHIEFGAGSDQERSAIPISTTFRSNLITNSDGLNKFRIHDSVEGIDFEGNICNWSEDLNLDLGLESASIELQKAENGLQYPQAEELAFVGVSRDLDVVGLDEVGAPWYPKPNSAEDESEETLGRIEVSPGIDSLFNAIASAGPGVTIELAPGDYLVRKIIVIDRPISIRASEGPGTSRVEFERSTLFEITDGGSLHLQGLNISGASSPDVAGNSVIRTSRYSMVQNYDLIIEDCTVQDLDTNHSFNFLSVAKNTFANQLRIKNSKFQQVSGNIISLFKERDDLGRYNGEFIALVDSEFEEIGGAVVDIYRGGTDESTFGPRFELRNCNLNSVGHSKRNKSKASIHLLGVQVADIHHNEIANSLPVRVVQTVGDPITRIGENSFIETSQPVVESLSTN